MLPGQSSPTPPPTPQPPNTNNTNNTPNSHTPTTTPNTNNTTNTTAFDDALFTTPPFLPLTTNARTEANFLERHRRQRTLRIFMMFLMLLLLMDGDEQQQQQQEERKRKNDYHPLRANKNKKGGLLNGSVDNSVNDPYKVRKESVFKERRALDEFIAHFVVHNPIALNKMSSSNNDDDRLDKKEDTTSTTIEQIKDKKELEEEEEIEVYPRNVTGYYRGEWSTIDISPFATADANTSPTKQQQKEMHWKKNNNHYLSNPKMDLNRMGINLLPPGYIITSYNATNALTNATNNTATSTTNNKPQKENEIIESKFTSQTYKIEKKKQPETSKKKKNKPIPSKTTIKSKAGRIAFQMYMKSIVGMSEVYYLDGFIKIYDGGTGSVGTSATVGVATRRDLLLRSHGLYLPNTGLISLVANADVDRSVFYLPKEEGDDELDWEEEEEEEEDSSRKLKISYVEPSKNQSRFTSTTSSSQSTTISDEQEWNEFLNRNTIIPFPYIPIDNDHDNNNPQHNKNPSTRILPIREQALQANAAQCEFEINLHVKPKKTSISKYETLQRLRKQFTQYAAPSKNDEDKKQHSTKPMVPPKELLVSAFEGIIYSPNCDFHTNVTATALRIDWESTTGKAINYSFYMMLTCLTQIVVLLRQLLHTQAQSAACRVSLLCIGWQALLDAILCIGHVLLCLMMQPLFTAFASVAFFKLLIFCVIEMKYMAIILQARHNAVQHVNTDRMRQLIAQLHVRFYMCLFATLTLVWYIGSSKKDLLVLEVLVLYSFWIPQIIQNIITEAKRPLHLHYIYGMTATRMIAPTYIFGFHTNFLKEVNPDFPIHPTLCLYLIAWLAIQATVLVCQGKYGARFMIPARFLPPKFDYSRPIPSSLLPSNENHTHTLPAGISSSASVSENSSLIVSDSSSNSSTSSTTRIRNKSTHHHNTTNPTITTPTTTTEHNNTNTIPNTLDCVICYNPIDVYNPRRYMIAPCDHIFHRHCLEQWMDVKMECPICRMDLPPI